MGVIALVVVSLIAFGEAVVIVALINRLLVQANVEPVSFALPKQAEPPEAPPQKKPIFKVNFQS